MKAEKKVQELEQAMALLQQRLDEQQQATEAAIFDLEWERVSNAKKQTVLVNHGKLAKAESLVIDPAKDDFKAIVRKCVRSRFDIYIIKDMLEEAYSLQQDRSKGKRDVKHENPEKYSMDRAKKILGDILKEPAIVEFLGKKYSVKDYINK